MDGEAENMRPVRAMFLPTLTTNTSDSWHSALSDSSPGASEVCKELGQCRTLLSIVWSCLSVILACTWLAIHPDVPSPYDTTWHRLRRRLGLTVVGLIAPELIMLLAAGQWRSAKRTEKELRRLDGSAGPERASVSMAANGTHEESIDLLDNASGRGRTQWTVTHGFFLQMGGFVAVVDDSVSRSNTGMAPLRNCTTLILPPSFSRGWKSPDGLLCVDNPDVRKAVGFFTEAEIKDKSKSSDLAKILVCGQTAWFVTQCIARAAQGLAITQLEMSTVAFVVMNFVTYFFWWNKPSDVDCPIRVRMKIPVASVDVESEGGSGSPGGLPSTIRLFFEGFAPMWIRFLLIPLQDILDLALALAVDRRNARNLRTSNDPRPQIIISRILEYGIGIIVTLLIGSIFGGIHCLAWSEYFPSLTETWLWRGSALAGTCLPLLMAIIVVVPVLTDGVVGTIVGTLSPYTVPMLSIIYPIARIILLVEAFTLLRSLPLSAYQTVEWTTFIPHIQ